MLEGHDLENKTAHFRKSYKYYMGTEDSVLDFNAWVEELKSAAVRSALGSAMDAVHHLVDLESEAMTEIVSQSEMTVGNLRVNFAALVKQTTGDDEIAEQAYKAVDAAIAVERADASYRALIKSGDQIEQTLTVFEATDGDVFVPEGWGK